MIIYTHIQTFQSTLPRRERRQPSESILRHFRRISIHTPTKGATIFRIQKTLARAFQSTLPRRERLWLDEKAVKILLFQSTLPRRERLKKTGKRCFYYGISIHTPTKGATWLDEKAVKILLFQSTLPRRERLYSLILNSYSSLFQSTLPRRERQQY